MSHAEEIIAQLSMFSPNHLFRPIFLFYNLFVVKWQAAVTNIDISMLMQNSRKDVFLMCKYVLCIWKWDKHRTCNSATKQHLFDSINFNFRHWRLSNRTFQQTLWKGLKRKQCSPDEHCSGFILPLTIFVRRNGVERWTRLSGNRQIVYNL